MQKHLVIISCFITNKLKIVQPVMVGGVGGGGTQCCETERKLQCIEHIKNKRRERF